MRVKANPKRILSTYCIPNVGLYLLGTFDVGVTVLSQQIRALNLAWALVETERVPADKRIAVVGGGFAGLTIAAGLLRKEAQVHITIFERRDTLLPLQQGSDTRWLHPRIYDWPAMGSEAGSAMLPILNWTAARASDVVVQVMREWQKTLDDAPEALKGNLALYCNTRHLQVHLATGNSRNLRIEWVGERRSPSDGVSLQNGMSVATGGSQEFDIVILAVGFGLERDQALSYWRNEILAQPNLDRPRLIYVVSGQGDGAMMDLFRLRIAQFRQDRILSELFEGKAALLAKLRTLQETYQDNASKGGLFDALESFYDETQDEIESVKQSLARRLRRDTEVILHLKVKKLSELFDPTKTRISFQNKLLVYLLYKCGGFFPSSLELDKLLKQHAIEEQYVVRRHGTERDALLAELLSEDLDQAIKKRRKGSFHQTERVCWPGGILVTLESQTMQRA